MFISKYIDVSTHVNHRIDLMCYFVTNNRTEEKKKKKWRDYNLIPKKCTEINRQMAFDLAIETTHVQKIKKKKISTSVFE